jgi:hypothetical protein
MCNNAFIPKNLVKFMSSIFDKMTAKSIVKLSMFTGYGLGILSVLIAEYSCSTSQPSVARVYHEPNKPTAMKVFYQDRIGTDRYKKEIFVEDPNHKGGLTQDFLPLEEYLKSVPGQYDRDIARLEIQKLSRF